MPGDFSPLLESTTLIIDVGLWVLEQACRQGARWRSEGFELDISVNVSTRQLESTQFVEDVERVLVSSNLEPSALIVEITESSMMRDVDAVIPILQLLKEIGIRIAIDDFGTGYSSLASLQRFPIDTIKIDQSFIARMGESSEAAAMIRTLVQLGRTLGLETLAEGIEGPDQCLSLEEEQCDSGQGYLFARPMEADAVATFLAERAPSRSAPEISTSGRRH
jgi:EAL domain-containing protein (putative c-di-GMP-specific phosphodiesterase class I)